MDSYMKIFIPTSGHHWRMSTLPLVEGLGVHLITSTEGAADNLRNQFGSKYVVTNSNIAELDLGTRTIAHLRQWVEDNLVQDREWYAMMDDNLQSVRFFDTLLDEVLDGSYARLMDTKCQPRDILKGLLETVDECEKQGTKYGGFTGVGNLAWRKKRWKYIGKVGAPVCVVKKNAKYNWISVLNGQQPEDWSRTVLSVVNHGCVVVNQFFNFQKVYGNGELGTNQTRYDAITETHTHLRRIYPDLLRPNPAKPNLESIFRVRYKPIG